MHQNFYEKQHFKSSNAVKSGKNNIFDIFTLCNVKKNEKQISRVFDKISKYCFYSINIFIPTKFFIDGPVFRL